MPHLSDGDLHEWLDGELPASSVEAESVRLHLETCPDCLARLEAARELRKESEEVLASAVPRETAPSFEQIRNRAFVVAPGAEGPTEPDRVRRPWLSVQRLGWAATVVLAVGAGWIGRAVLEEKGWTDPFHEGLPAASRVLDSETDGDVPREYFAREQEALEEAAGEPEASNEARADRGAVVKDEHAPSVPQAAAPQSTGALAKAGQPAEDTAGAPPREVAPVDEIAEARPEAERQEARAKSLRSALDPWHALPEPRLSGPGVDVAGCYRLEYSWSPGVADLPGTLELLSEESEGREGQAVFAVLSGSGRTTLHEAVWASPNPDSVWVRLVSGEDRDTFTVRAGRSGPDWAGEGRVLRPGGPVSVGQTRGAVDLVRIGCEPS